MIEDDAKDKKEDRRKHIKNKHLLDKKDIFLENNRINISKKEFKQNKIKTFVDDNTNNFSSLSDAEHQKGELLVLYFAKDDKPEEKFMEVKKAYSELNKAISSLSKELKDKAMTKYNEILDRLESKASELAVAIDSNNLPDRQKWLDKIKKLSSIPEIKLILSKASDFETENIQILFQIKSKEDESKGKIARLFTMLSMVEEPGGKNYIEIGNEEELDAFIQKFRERVLIQLKQNKIVGLK